MRILIFVASICFSLSVTAQVDLAQPFKECHIKGSTTIYNYKTKKWTFSDPEDAKTATLPASTFKVVNLLIALQTGVIRDEHEVIKWVGTTDTTLYGYRPEIYKDLTVKEAFEVSAGWVFIELAKKIGRAQYRYYLKACNYGNQKLDEAGTDFWNFGKFEISPKNQVDFLIKVYKGSLPFSKRNIEILKRVMITETTDNYIIRSKTGWTRANNEDVGWWVGYVERKDNVYFFATRIIKPRSVVNTNFGQCRKEITKHILKTMGAIE
ncbi:penicillin-binding transpeptidase domain-containing protein [Chitinophaga defluvii]|uniref:beta-lactamase n=1 Tax=Chitinophaga defluvii TaxID=3163343 RepID=A0ABV2TE48_9BACT